MIEQHIRCRLQYLLLIVTTFVSVLTSSLPTQANTSTQAVALSSRHPDAGIWVMYRGQNSVADLQKPYIKGVMAYARWNAIYTGPNNFDWSTLDAELDFIINQAGALRSKSLGRRSGRM